MKQTKKSTSHISADYEAQLRKDYGTLIAKTIATDWRFANLSQQPGQAIAYVRLGAGKKQATGRPVLFVPGFVGGIVANGAFGAAVASRGFDTLVPNQNRHGLLRNHRGLKDPTYTQAQNIMAIIASEGLEHVPLDIITHSYGGLILETMVREAERLGWTCFDSSRVVMLAPAGIKRPEWYPGFLYRYYQLRQFDRAALPETKYYVFAGEMFTAGESFYKQNRWRAIREGMAVMRRKIHIPYLLSHGIARIELIAFPGDALFGSNVLAKSFARIHNKKVVAVNGYSLPTSDASGHSDQQFDPQPIADVVARFLQA